MWETIGNVLNGNNGLIVIALIAVLIVVLIYMSKKGGFSIHTNFMSLGGADREREVIRHQVDTAHAQILLAMEELGVADDWHTKYIFERVYDKVVEWIMFNHITTHTLYVESKFMEVYNLCVMLGMVQIRENDNKDKLKKWVKDLVEQLLHIRKYYTEKQK